jgi:Cdc6-like AAA superfamily ATPase
VGIGKRVSSLLGRRERAPVVERDLSRPISELFAEPSRPTGGSLPRFKATAADQVDRRKSDRFTAMRMKLRNAFTPSQPVIDRHMFAGRTEVMSAMISAIEDQRLHLVIYGERGIGKTSLLHMLAEAAREARYIVIYSSCGAASAFTETFRAAAAEIPLLYHADYGPNSEEAEAGASLDDLLPERFTPRQFADLTTKVAGTRALIVLDEFDRCDSSEFRRDLAELVKFLSDRSVRIQLVIGGVAADLAELVEHIPSIRRNILAVRVPLMSEEEVRSLVATGEKASGLTFDKGAADFVVSIARGWPYIATLLCHHAGLNAIDAGRGTVLPDDVSAALAESLLELRARMAKGVQLQVERLLSEGGGKFLALLAGASLAAGGDFGASEIDAVAGKSDAAAAKRFADELAAERLLLDRKDDAYGRRYGFVEDSLPPYLWFLGQQQDFQDRQTKMPRVSNG